MTQQPDYNPTDAMFGGGRSLSFADPVTSKNRWRGGTVIAPPEQRQRTNYQTKQPEFWPDGAPKMQVVVRLQTTERDPADPNDNGIRTLFVKGNMQNAVGTALRAVNAPGLRVGGELYVMWTGEQASSKGAPQKLFTAQYRQPTAESLAAAQQAAAAPPAPLAPAYMPPVQQQAAPQFAQPDQQPQNWPPVAQQQATPTAQPPANWSPQAPAAPVAPQQPVANPFGQPQAPQQVPGGWPPAAPQPTQPQQLAGQPNPFAQPPTPEQPAQAQQAPPWATQG